VIQGYPIAGNATRTALRASLGDRAKQFQAWLGEGQLTSVLMVVERMPTALADLLPVLANPDAKMNLRLGAAAVFERHADSDALRALLPALGVLSAHDDHRVRADACHILGLSGAPDAVRFLGARLDDPDPEVREIATDSLHTLNLHRTKEAAP
jgi:hypothetical protein